MGRSPKRYYLQMRLERAHLLLVNSSLPIFEVAVACGFSSASHFSRTYRETYGCTPQRTRQAEHQYRQPMRSATNAADRRTSVMKVA
ncbi:Exoenzyme S synthesis regulatory protein ExsA [compost metagenome]